MRLLKILSALAFCVSLADRGECLEMKSVMVAAEHRLAADAGVRIMSDGGNAIDAACATALAVGVVNASSCGIGGGGFMLIYSARTRRIYALDYRETAPAAATPEKYSVNGHPDEDLLKTGPLAVAVPGEIAGIETALARFGTMRFSDVAQPAVELARDGFPCGAHLAHQIDQNKKALNSDPGLRSVFLNPDGSPIREGETIRNVRLAEMMESLGDHPRARFYHGKVASTIVDFLQSHGGIMTKSDLANYAPKWRRPLRASYRSYEVYSMPPPSSGGGVLLEMLKMLEPEPATSFDLASPTYLARLIETMREAFVDRAEYYGDPDFYRVPIGFLLSPDHIAELRERVAERLTSISPEVKTDHGTSHLCVVDAEGNMVSLTTTINTAFGAKIMVPELGIILNDEMDDFALSPGIANVYGLVGSEANSVEPRKRPLSSMTPTIVMKSGKPILTLGGSGGPTIITGSLEVILDILDMHLAPELAVSAPRIHEQAVPETVTVEERMPQATRDRLERMGYKLRVIPAIGDVEVIEIGRGSLRGAADGRKAGEAAGY
jgi:gamma-glutamyltranspeptidase/glutathione hydrolase